MERVGSTRTMPRPRRPRRSSRWRTRRRWRFGGTSICTSLVSPPVRPRPPERRSAPLRRPCRGRRRTGAGGGGGFSDNACFHVHITFPTVALRRPRISPDRRRPRRPAFPSCARPAAARSPRHPAAAAPHRKRRSRRTASCRRQGCSRAGLPLTIQRGPRHRAAPHPGMKDILAAGKRPPVNAASRCGGRGRRRRGDQGFRGEPAQG